MTLSNIIINAQSNWRIFQQLQVRFVREKFPGAEARHPSFHHVQPGPEEHQHRVGPRGETEQDLQHHHQSVQQVPPQHDCGPPQGQQILSHPSPSHLQLQTSQRRGQVQPGEASQRYWLRARLRAAQIRLLQTASVEEKWLEETSEIILNLNHDWLHSTGTISHSPDNIFLTTTKEKICIFSNEIISEEMIIIEKIFIWIQKNFSVREEIFLFIEFLTLSSAFPFF